MNVLDLFSGIGGFSLGLERAGMRTVAFCEIEPYCRAVLRKHWPGIPCYDDIRTLTAERLKADGIAPIDVICGGFPCQDISFAGKGAGLSGERSGLWREYARLIGEIRPRFVIVENVAALLGRGLGRVLGDLSKIGYDTQWHIISASDVGAPHLRERVWILANANHSRNRFNEFRFDRFRQKESKKRGGQSGVEFSESGSIIPNSERIGQSGSRLHGGRINQAPSKDRQADWTIYGGEGNETIWNAEPAVDRVAHGIPARMDRLKSLGNAVVPQIPEIIGRAIMESVNA